MKKDKDFAAARKEVEYKTKSGTAWSHSYLNQKPWHPLSYPNQRRKWIAEQTHGERERRAEDVAREFAQEQEFFRTSALLSKQEREKVEAMQAVSFMYMRPPGYNAESARAAELADEKKSLDTEANTNVVKCDEKSKRRVKDLYGKTVPTEEEFPFLKNAPRLESGATARVKPFAVEIRNVKCARCGNFGHQSGDRECPLKDSIMPNEEARQKRDDPLTVMNAVFTEPLKWELKQRPGGLSPPRGGFKAGDPNQQIIPEDIYDEYGGFLAGGMEVEELLASFSQMKHKRSEKKKQKKSKGGRNLVDDSNRKKRTEMLEFNKLSDSDSNGKRKRTDSRGSQKHEGGKYAEGHKDEGRKRKEKHKPKSSNGGDDAYYRRKRKREKRRKHMRKGDQGPKKNRRHSDTSSSESFLSDG